MIQQSIEVAQLTDWLVNPVAFWSQIYEHIMLNQLQTDLLYYLMLVCKR